MRVVCIAAECEPWAKTGGLGDVVDALARAVGATGATREEGVPTNPAGAPMAPAGAPAAPPPSRKPRAPQSQVWVGTGGVMGVGISELDLPGHVEAPVDVFLPMYRGVEVPPGATSRPLDVPDPLAESGTTEVRLVEF